MNWIDKDWKFPSTPQEMEEVFPNLVKDMKESEQSPDYHAEGDVWTHTKMVIDALQNDVQWQFLSDIEKEILVAAAFFHDVAKPKTAKIIDGRISNPKHSVLGARMVREALWDHRSADYYPAPWDVREYISNLTLLHMLPVRFLDKSNPAYFVGAASQVIDNSHLAILARADNKGRICSDPSINRNAEDMISLYKEFCGENRCLEKPMPFQSDNARFRYFFERKGDPRIDYYEPTKGTAIIMSALQGTGKDYTIKKEYSDLPSEGYDSIREKLGLKFGKAESLVQTELKENLNQHMREGNDFVFNATNLIKDIRSNWIRRFRKYGYRIKIHYVEKPLKETLKQNSNRDYVVPEKVILQKFSRIDVPTVLECHELVKDV